MKVQDAMTTPPVVVATTTTFTELAKLLRLHRISGLPVVDEEGRLVGVVSESDLLRRLARMELERVLRLPVESRSVRVAGDTAAELMTAPPIAIGPDSTLDEALSLMRVHASRRLPVTDAEGRPVGVLSRTDLLAPFLRDDDEIRAEIVEDLLSPWGADSVRLRVSEGDVQIEGTLGDRRTVKAVEDGLREIEGVVSVESRLGPRYGVRPHHPPAEGHPTPVEVHGDEGW